MKIVFDNLNFSESLQIGFKSKHQLPWIMVIREYRDPKTGEEFQPDLIWSSTDLWRTPLFKFKFFMKRFT